MMAVALVGASSLWPFDWVLFGSALVASTLIILFVKMTRFKKYFSQRK
jgi:hypothetical protein